MLKINCDYCDKELTEPGALIFSPPDEDGRVWKFHKCVDCWVFYLEEWRKVI